MRKHAFTHCINEQNVNDALAAGLTRLLASGVAEPSRGGQVVSMDTPVITCYRRPCERVLFSPMRDANPFFHFFEGLWMLAGRNDVAWPSQFNSKFSQFSDDGKTFWGAYGYRWRNWFGYDQLQDIIAGLRANPADRRLVLTMWDATELTEDGEVQPGGQADLRMGFQGGSDVPCNTNVFFRVQDGELDMMVNCRSNDIIWGAYGANAVHMSMLQEYIALSAGLRVGRYWQNSWNFHAYTDRFPLESFAAMSHDASTSNHYKRPEIEPFPLMSDPAGWDADLARFMDWAFLPPEQGYNDEAPHFADRFFGSVAVPMRLAWAAHKDKDYPKAQGLGHSIAATDWRLACLGWISRRQETHEAKGLSDAR